MMFLGIDWLNQYQATIDCNQKTLTLTTSKGKEFGIKEETPLLRFH